MRVRDHVSQHDAADALPLVTESAVVTGLEAMDRNRTADTIAAIETLLETYGSDRYDTVAPATEAARRHWLRDQLDELDHVDDGGVLDEYLTPTASDSDPGSAVATLETRYRRPFPSLVELEVTTDSPVEFQPGQYLSLRFEDVTRPYSIASPPTTESLAFCIRRVPGGDLTPGLIDMVEPGTELSLRGPYGELLLQEPSKRDVVFLATGTGVAPFRPMIDYLFETGRDVVDGHRRDVWLFLGAGWEDDLPYDEYFTALAADREQFHYVPTLTRESLLTDWGGETEYVQDVFAKYIDATTVDVDPETAYEQPLNTDPVDDIESRLDPHDIDVYACGVTAMVTSLVEAVEGLGVPESRTEFEAFG